MPEHPSSMFSQPHVAQEAGADGEMSFLFGTQMDVLSARAKEKRVVRNQKNDHGALDQLALGVLHLFTCFHRCYVGFSGLSAKSG